MTPRKPLVQIALVLALVSGSSALLAQLSNRSAPGQAPQKEASAPSAANSRAGVRIAQATEPAAQPAPAVDPAPAAAPAGELTPLEAQAAVRREKAARDFMTGRGFSDKATQDAIVNYLQGQESAREALAEAGRTLLPALVTQGRGAVADAQVETLVAQYQKQLAAYNSQSQKDQAALDAAIGFSKKPRLQAMLLLMGALDQGPRILPVWRPLRPEGVSRPRQSKPAA